jgi:MFS family permease
MRLSTHRPEIWILIVGRLLSQVGTGFTLFYLPIFFVNEVGLSATIVGTALGSASLSGILGRFLGGTMVDSPQWGRRRTLLLSVAISGCGAFAFAVAHDTPSLFLGNLLMGFGVGLYWPATEAIVADLSPVQQRSEAYALTRLADSLGLGVGVILGGVIISLAHAYRWLFIGDGISFFVFMALIFRRIPETAQPGARSQQGWKGWSVALQDRRLLTYCVVNVLITTYIAQTNSTIPLYFRNFPNQGAGFSEGVISIFIAFSLVLSVVLQLPIARWLRRYRYAQALAFSLLFWGIGFALVGVCGIVTGGSLFWAVLSMGILAIASVSYTPIASALVATLAPENARGVYLSINSQCWAIGYLIGPALGGAAMDLPRPLVDYYWWGVALLVSGGWIVLKYLDRQLQDL